MNKKFFALLAALLCFSTFSVFAQTSEEAVPETEAVAVQQTVAEETENSEKSSSGLKYIAAALAVCVACLAGGMAVGKIGSAAMGAMSENPELSGKALPFVGLAEGICLWGFLVALLIIIL